MANRLAGEFGQHFTRETLEHYVADSYERLAANARVLDHLPPLVERFSRDRLRALAKNDGLVERHPVEVLFVCERNDAASQIAASFFNNIAVHRGFAHSAGARPASELLDDAVAVMREIGVEFVDEFPKPITPEVEMAADVIVTLDVHDAIAIVEGKQFHAWDLPDPRDRGLSGYRALRDDLRTRVEGLIDQVVP